MTSGARIGILGGTFDPVHVGHVETALAALRAMGLDRVLLMPSGIPPHRQQQPSASRFHRFAMTALATNGVGGLVVSDLEIDAPGPSYTADTLTRLHATGIGALQMFFITGADAFAEIATWSRYPQVLDMSHFVVVSRPGHPAPALVTKLPTLAARMTEQTTERLATANPTVFLVNTPTPDVSSTAIRRRLRAGGSVSGLVPEAVEIYIQQHGLYSHGDSAASIQATADHLHDQS
jgi:nicotinate-nucleotide adenylyltransferase